MPACLPPGARRHARAAGVSCKGLCAWWGLVSLSVASLRQAGPAATFTQSHSRPEPCPRYGAAHLRPGRGRRQNAALHACPDMQAHFLPLPHPCRAYGRHCMSSDYHPSASSSSGWSGGSASSSRGELPAPRAQPMLRMVAVLLPCIILLPPALSNCHTLSTELECGQCPVIIHTLSPAGGRAGSPNVVVLHRPS